MQLNLDINYNKIESFGLTLLELGRLCFNLHDY